MATDKDTQKAETMLCKVDLASDAEFGFTRPGFGQGLLAGSVDFYERHVFLRYKTPSLWPSNIGGEEIDELPRLLDAAVRTNKGCMKRQTRITLCEGRDDAAEASNGDVLIFPDMIRYRRLTHADVDSFVEQVLVTGGKWAHSDPEMLQGSYIFVCCHAAKDLRCGVCGPALVERFKQEIEAIGLQHRVSVCPCSHLGGHKYAGNVIIFGASVDGTVTGHWYGYVTPDDVPELLEEHILGGTIVNQLWRGQMGLTEDQQKLSHQRRLHENAAVSKKGTNKIKRGQKGDSKLEACSSGEITEGCCQQDPSSCCQSRKLANAGLSNQKKGIVNKVSRI
uniref:Sucrase/ferredoxin-like family protein n=1 Tax=Kalanchoe fedtschenkoi TaxID=63787 RepID=A0A7N0ZY87_KALFE